MELCGNVTIRTVPGFPRDNFFLPVKNAVSRDIRVQ